MWLMISEYPNLAYKVKLSIRIKLNILFITIREEIFFDQFNHDILLLQCVYDKKIMALNKIEIIAISVLHLVLLRFGQKKANRFRIFCLFNNARITIISERKL